MARNRVGILGHYYNGMLDIYSDPTQHSAFFGCHIEHLEMCELKRLRDNVTETDIDKKIQQFYNEFEVIPECSLEEMKRAAKTACALDAMVAEKNWVL